VLRVKGRGISSPLSASNMPVSGGICDRYFSKTMPLRADPVGRCKVPE
jgi:hypothetical protein